MGENDAKCFDLLADGWIRLNRDELSEEQYDRNLWILERIHEIFTQDVHASWCITKSILKLDVEGELNHLIGASLIRDLIDVFGVDAENLIREDIGNIPKLEECLKYARKVKEEPGDR